MAAAGIVQRGEPVLSAVCEPFDLPAEAGAVREVIDRPQRIVYPRSGRSHVRLVTLDRDTTITTTCNPRHVQPWEEPLSTRACRRS